MVESHRLVHRLISQAGDLAEKIGYGQIVLQIKGGKVVRAEVKESIQPKPTAVNG